MEKKYPCILIDDQIEDLELMRSILAGSSLLRVTQAFRKFEEAEAYLREESTDLIVSDIELLQDNQLVYNCLHELPAGIPICLVSGYPVFAARSFSYVRDNPDVIGILNKPFTPSLSSELETLFLQYLEHRHSPQGSALEKERLLQRAKTCKLRLYKQKDLGPQISSSLPYTNIIMAFYERSCRGLVIHTKVSPKPFYLPGTNLKDCFTELEKQCPGLFCCVGRSAFVNVLNVTLNGNCLIPKKPYDANRQLAVRLPARFPKENLSRFTN